MNTIKVFLVVLAVCLNANISFSQESGNRFTILVPTVEQEATSVWRIINDIQFFNNHGYSVNLPHCRQVDSLLIKSKNGMFSNNDYSSIFELIESDFYNEENYLAAYEKVKQQEVVVNTMIGQLDSLRNLWDWDFKMFANYDVLFTLYGSGGSYNANIGGIALFTNNYGDFKSYSNPANTIIHEIVHIGIEESIVQKYKLSHILKERIVDRIVFIYFSDVLPEYKIQNMGETNVDALLKDKNDVANLNSIIGNNYEH